jgi:hypothetical protein
MAVNIRYQDIVSRAAGRLDELIAACKRLGPIYVHDPALTADVTRKAKALRTALAKLPATFDDPDHQPGKEAPARQDKLALRLAFQPHLAELVRCVSYGGRREQDFWEHYTGLIGDFQEVRRG